MLRPLSLKSFPEKILRLFSLGISAATLSLGVLLIGCDAASPSTTVNLSLTGAVRDTATGEAVPGTEVYLYVLNEDFTVTTLARITVGNDGRYALSHRLGNVATEDELGGTCAIWNRGVTAEVSLVAVADGYADGRFFSSVPVACVEIPQTIDLALNPQ